MEIDKTMYDAFDRFELDDISFFNKWDKHLEHSELTESSLNQRAFHKEESFEDMVIRNIDNELLHKAIGKLPEAQQRRLLLYYFEGLSLEEIAAKEGCSHQAVNKSIMVAIKKLKNILNNRVAK
ncbi:RNA polymerase sigma factor (sigma-70 family) [Lachnospiraceae bacterium PF1-21]